VDLPARLLDVAAAVTWDGGDRVLAALARHLRELVPCDAAELVMPRVFGFDRWTLSENGAPLLPDDLLLQLVDTQEPQRIDDVAAITGFDRGRDELLARTIGSILALPLGSAGGARGLVVLGKAATWGFAGAPLRVLTDLVGMAGLSLETAAVLTKVRREANDR
jgi:hypothetical protein